MPSAASSHMVCFSPVAGTRIGARTMDLERLSQDAYGEAGPVKINPWGQAMTQRRRRVA
jgi:hypothetical protein